MHFKDLVKCFLPPIILDVKRKIFNPNVPIENCIKFSGDYPTWDAALKDSIGYDSWMILEKVKDSAMAVKAGVAAFERDSVLFYKEDYNWPLLAMLLKIAGENGKKLSVIDFGGSLGSTYFQHRKMLFEFDLQWNIIEQKHFVEFGRENLEDNNLRFFNDINEFENKSARADVILLSSVLQYIENPLDLIQKLLNLQINYIIIDRTPFSDSAKDDRLTIQKVPVQIYDASYPAWFFSLEKFLDRISKSYNLVLDGMSPEGIVTLDHPKAKSKYYTMFFKKKV